MNKYAQTGLTLLELTVVLLVLIALAGVAVPYLSGTSSRALCEATDISMQNLKKIIMERYYLDALGSFPSINPNGNDYSLDALFAPHGWSTYNPDTKTGWRGPYVQNGVSLNASTEFNAGYLHGSFKDASSTSPHVHYDLADTQTVIPDGWGRPIIIQMSPYGPRLVSAGPGRGMGLRDENGILQAEIDTLISDALAQADDRILNLQGSTQANTSCDQL